VVAFDAEVTAKAAVAQPIRLGGGHPVVVIGRVG
jgi:hypothetical protein